MVPEGRGSHRGFSSYRSQYPEEQKDLQRKHQQPEVRETPDCSSRGASASASAAAASPQKPQPRGLDVAAAALSSSFCRQPASAFVFSGQPHGIPSVGLALPHRSRVRLAPPAPPSLRCSGQARGCLKAGRAQQSRGVTRAIPPPGISRRSWALPVPSRRATEAEEWPVSSSRRRAGLAQGRESPETLFRRGLHLSWGAEPSRAHGR